MATSGTYNFQSIEIELIIREAYENIGILGEFVESQKLDSAKRSLDLLFLEWMNKSINLWTLKTAYLPLVPSQATYILPTQVSDIVQLNLRTSLRQLNGTPTTSNGGTASFAFDGNSATACTQTAPNGNIAYDFGAIRQLGGVATTSDGGVADNAFDGDSSTACTQANPNGNIAYDFGTAFQAIDVVGIQTVDTRLYDIYIESSQDNINWTTIHTIFEQEFTAGQNQWFDITNPAMARSYRIRAYNNDQLDIQEIFFSNKTNNSPVINFVGIQSNDTAIYNIVVEGSDDSQSWTLLLTATAQAFTSGVNNWFDIPTPVARRYYRVRAFSATTLNIQEIFFNNNLLDLPISNVSRYEYYTFPNKQLQSRPNCYYLDRGLQPVLNIWPVPDSQYNCAQYSYKKMIQDTGDLYTNTLEIPSRFYPPLIWGLSARLAIKFNPQIADVLEDKYEKAFAIASNEDTEHTPINIYVDYEDAGY